MSEQHDSPPWASAELLEWIDAIADRFEAAWRQGPPPRIAEFLGNEAGPRRLPLLHELLKIDLSYRRRRGDRCQLEDYLADFPELLGPGGVLPDSLVLHARNLGERPAGEREAATPLKTPGPGSGEEGTVLRCPQCGRTMEGVGSQARDATCPGCGVVFPVGPWPAESRPADLPRTLGKFQLLELLGSGSFGAVHKARDAELGRVVAVKVPRAGCFATAEEEERFLREARSAAQLTHPGIVPVHEIARAGDLPCIVSEYVAGPSLAAMLAGRHPGFRESAELAAQV